MVVLLAAVLSAACSAAFSITPTGSVARGIDFQLAPGERRIKEVVVQIRAGEEWTTIWHVQGNQRLRTIRYGASYAGLIILVPPAALASGEEYRVLAKDETGFTAPIGYGTRFFAISLAGDIELRDQHD